MAMRSTLAFSAIPRGMLLRRLFSSATDGFPSFVPPTTAAAPATPGREQAEPNTNLFVSGLSKRTTTEGLRNAFAQFGDVLYARVVTDRNSGFSKGFGFVRYATLEDAKKGIEGMDGKFLDGWVIFAEYARPRPTPTAAENTMGLGYGSSNGPSYGQ